MLGVWFRVKQATIPSAPRASRDAERVALSASHTWHSMELLSEVQEEPKREKADSGRHDAQPPASLGDGDRTGVGGGYRLVEF